MEFPHTILVVDDNPATRYTTSRVLRSVGYEVAEAGTGKKALGMASTHPDLVILDVNLPDISGFEVCQKLRQIPETAFVPVIHLSADHISNADKIRGLEMGADGYLTHPTEPAVLVATVKAFLRARHAEEALRISESRFKAVFENSVNGIAIFDSELNFLELNPSFCGLLGESRQDLLGKALEGKLAEESGQRSAQILRELSDHGCWRGNFAIDGAERGIVQLEGNISPHVEPDTYLVVVSDVTERLALEAHRQELLSSERMARTEAERANRLKDEFLATVSHELRTPLTSIIGWAELLQHQPPQSDVQRGLQVILRNAKSQAELISDLLDVARITSGKLRLDLDTINLREIATSAIQIISQTAEAKKQTVTIDLDQVALVQADSVRIHQVLLNLLTNAVKFTQEGGAITIKLRDLPDRLELSVADNGQGIGPELLPVVFERFRQADGSTTRSHGGLGLGLAIARRIVELHGGDLSATSPGANQGSVFKLSLPKAKDSVDAIPPAKPVAPGKSGNFVSLKNIDVLVVEDDQDSRDTICRILRESGADVRGAGSVDEATVKLEEKRPDILVSDIGMPNKDGFDLIATVRLCFDAEELPAIAMTAYSRPIDTARLKEAGYQLHLVKPVPPSSLTAAIQALCSSQAQKIP